MHRLGNQVVLVEGARRSALYDLHRCRLVRIPALVARWVGRHSQMVIPAEAMNTSVVQDLLARRFVVEMDAFEERFRLPFDTLSGAPRIPLLHTITVEVSSVFASQLTWATQAVAIGARGLTVYCGDRSPDEVRREVFAAISTQRTPAFRFVETIPGSPGQGALSGIFNAEGELIARRRSVDGPGAFGAKLRVDEAHFSLLRRCSEMTGHIFIDAEGALKPHWAELTVRYGMLGDTTPLQLLKSPVYRRIQTATKDRRNRCKDCELRYACVHPLSDREDPLDLYSAPSSCLYDPAAQTNQWHLFAHE